MDFVQRQQSAFGNFINTASLCYEFWDKQYLFWADALLFDSMDATNDFFGSGDIQDGTFEKFDFYIVTTYYVHHYRFL